MRVENAVERVCKGRRYGVRVAACVLRRACSGVRVASCRDCARAFASTTVFGSVRLRSLPLSALFTVRASGVRGVSQGRRHSSRNHAAPREDDRRRNLQHCSEESPLSTSAVVARSLGRGGLRLGVSPARLSASMR